MAFQQQVQPQQFNSAYSQQDQAPKHSVARNLGLAALAMGALYGGHKLLNSGKLNSLLGVLPNSINKQEVIEQAVQNSVADKLGAMPKAKATQLVEEVASTTSSPTSEIKG